MRTTNTSGVPSHPAKRASILLNVQDHAHHGSLMVRLLQRAKRAKLSGATVFQAQVGFGESGRTHRTHLMSDDAPVTVVIIDLPDRIDAFLDEAADLLDGALVIIDDVDVIEHGAMLDGPSHR